MDTISRENNSFLPLAGVIAGALALLLAIVALFKLSASGKEIAKLNEDLNSRIMSMESQVSQAASDASSAKGSFSNLQRDTQAGFNAVADQLSSIRGEIAKLQESVTKPRAAATAANGKAAKEPAVAGPDEYIVKAGDTSGTKIAKANGVSIGDLQAVNPGVNWNKLKIGDKLKLPKK
jgi:LysM repeat protein